MTQKEEQAIGHGIGDTFSQEGKEYRIIAHRRKSLLIEDEEGIQKFTWPQ